MNVDNRVQLVDSVGIVHALGKEIVKVTVYEATRMNTFWGKRRRAFHNKFLSLSVIFLAPFFCPKGIHAFK